MSENLIVAHLNNKITIEDSAQKIRIPTHKNPLLDLILSQTKPVHIHFHIFLPM